MEAWVLWLIAAVLFAAGEIATLGFFLAPFAGGALVAALLAGVGAGTLLELAAFLVVSTALLAAMRPLARSHARMPPQIRTGTAALIGRTGVIVDRTDANAGSIKLEGEVWTARPYEEDAVYEPGARVQVVEIKGAIALVTD